MQMPMKIGELDYKQEKVLAFNGTTISEFVPKSGEMKNDTESVLEVKQIIGVLNSEYGSNGKWILMGDFNSTPDRYDCDNRPIHPNWLNYIRVSSTQLRATEKDYCYLLCSDRPTQGAGECEQETWTMCLCRNPWENPGWFACGIILRWKIIL